MFGTTVELLTYPTIRDRGRDVPDYSQQPATVKIKGVDLQPGPSTELVAQRRDTTAVRWSAFVPAEAVPAGVTLGPKSVVRIPGGEVCQVDGQPLAWIDGSPLDHYLVALTEWKPAQ